MTHQKHKKCPECGKALYRKKKKGESAKVKDPWRFCRNPACSLFERDQKPQFEKESKVVEDVRRTVLEAISDKNKKTSYILLVAIVAQEIGFSSLSEKIIKKYKLNELYDINV